MRLGTGPRQFLRYAVVGLASNVLLYLAYLGLTAVGVGVKLAMTLLYFAGVAQSFIFNKRWSFEHAGAHGPAFLRYCSCYALGYVINLASLFIFVDILGYPHQLVQGVLILSLAVMLFVLQKYWVFRSSTDCMAAATPRS